MTNMRKLRFLTYHTTTADHVGEIGTIFFDPASATLRIGDGETAGGHAVGGGSAALPVVTIISADEAQTANDSVGSIGDSGLAWYQPGTADVLFTVSSDDTITSGVIRFYNGIVATTAGGTTPGANGVRFNTENDQENFVVIAYATNTFGTTYSAPVSGHSRPLCLAAGTMIALSDGTQKPIEDITYADDLLVWDFDLGRFAESRPMWIKQPRAALAYNRLVFDDGTVLNTVGQHRIFHKEAGQFTYPLTDETPLGATSFNRDAREIRLVEKHVVQEPTVSYNIISNYHMNLFANGVLTSNSFNNLYPIVEMRFVKDDRALRSYGNMPAKFRHGMRLTEQTIDDTVIQRYIDRLITTDVMA